MNEMAARSAALPRIDIGTGTLESLKWLALLLMIGDHINKYLLGHSVTWLYDAGRVAMPLFVFVLAYNLARPGTLERGVYRRTLLRLAIFGALATPAFVGLGGLVDGWWPLNILFTLFVLTATLRMLETGSLRAYFLAGLLFTLGGGLVEYWWPAIAFGVAIWSYRIHPSVPAVFAAFASCAMLGLINGNQMALASILILWAAHCVDLPCPRLRWFFYAFYPAHLSLIWLWCAGLS